MLIEEAKRGTCQHWTCSVPILKAWMESASTSSDLISQVSSLADSDIRDVDLDSVNVGAISQVVESSRKQPREEPSSGRAMFPHFKHGYSLLLPAQT